MGVRMKIRELSTGKTVASTWNTNTFACWRTVEPVIADWYECSPDDIEIVEDENGAGDFVTANGVRVAEIEETRDLASLRAVRPLAQAAE